MTNLDLAMIEEFVLSGGCLGPGKLREVLEQFGIVDSTGKIVEYDRLQRMIRLADAPQDEQSIALQLPPHAPLRKFYEQAIIANSGAAQQILGILRRHLPDLLSASSPQTKKADPEIPSADYGERLWRRFQNEAPFGNFLGNPSYRRAPERIVWILRQDLASGLEAHFDEKERRKAQGYQILLANPPNADAQAIGLGIPPSSLPAMRAWLSRSGGCPPAILPGLFQLHLGKGRVRANLFCAAKSPLLPLFTQRFLAAADHLDGLTGLVISGPLPSWDGHKTFSAAKIWELPKPLTENSHEEVIRFSVESWKSMRNVLEVCRRCYPSK
jgi:hypothetical protein